MIKYIIVFFYLIFLDVSAAEYLKFNSKGKNRKKLNEAVKLTLDFFKGNLN